MKTASSETRINNLMLDVVEYAFTEWLVRRGVFTAFRTNYDAVVSPYRGFRDRLRAHILRSLCSPNLDPSSLLSSAFLFTSTPEGYDFWNKHSEAWGRFCARFRTRF